MDFERYLHAVIRSWRLVLALVVVGVVAAVALTVTATKQYESTTRLYVSLNPLESESVDGYGYIAQRLSSYGNLVMSGLMGDRVDTALEGTPEADASSSVVAMVIPGTAVLQITVTSPDEEAAQILANTYADQFLSLVEELEPSSQDTQTVTKITVIDPASSATVVSPDLGRNLRSGVLFGLVAGLLIALGRELVGHSREIGHDRATV